MSGVHDMGGDPNAGPIDRNEHEIEDWERIAEAINAALTQKGLKRTDEQRRAIENLDGYLELGYYERWAAANEALLIEKGILTKEEIDTKAADIERRWGSR